MRCFTRYLFSITCFCLFSGFFNSASALDAKSYNIFDTKPLLDIKTSANGSYQIAKSVFLPNIKDSEIGFVSGGGNNSSSGSSCGSEYSLRACPRYGKCTECLNDTVTKFYRWDGCIDGYYPNPNFENTCTKYACHVEDYMSVVPKAGNVCTKLERYGLTCYDCDSNSEYKEYCSTSQLDSTEGLERIEENPACINLPSNKFCSEQHCKLICKEGYYTTSYTHKCNKDSCPSGYQLEACSSSQVEQGTVKSIFGTTTCYKCTDDSCPDGYSKAACQDGYTTVDTKVTASGTTCRKCESIDKLCSDYPLTSCGKNMTCSTCPYDSGRYKFVECTNNSIPQPKDNPTKCVDFTSCTLLGDGYKDDMVAGDLCSEKTENGRLCYFGCINYPEYADSCSPYTGTKRTENPSCLSLKSGQYCHPSHCKTTCEQGYYLSSGMCYTDSCPAGYQFEKCSSTKYNVAQSTSGQNTCYQCQTAVFTDCYPGYILYADKTCSSLETFQNESTGKTAIGVVLSKERGLAAALTCTKAPWQTSPSDVPGMPSDTNVTVDSLRLDFNGKFYTSKIISQCSTGDAAHYALSYSTEGTNVGDWWLPSVGEVDLLNNSDVKNTMSAINYDCSSYRAEFLWTSNEGWDGKFTGIPSSSKEAFFYSFRNGGYPALVSKDSQYYVIPVTSFEANVQ